MKLAQELVKANDICRSMAKIVQRKGKKTNWDSFSSMLGEALESQDALLNLKIKDV